MIQKKEKRKHPATSDIANFKDYSNHFLTANDDVICTAANGDGIGAADNVKDDAHANEIGTVALADNFENVTADACEIAAAAAAEFISSEINEPNNNGMISSFDENY